jgi:fructose-1,6-bisphosphatase/inositol monophosphatase family enzyme/glutathione synthase/RimK-type ligase-like ATP-grasp enzyme
MRIAFLLARHPPDRKSPVLPEVYDRLRARGHQVDLIHPEEGMVDLAEVNVEHDLYVLKFRSEIALSLAGALHARGAALLNPYPAAAALRDKVVATRLLQAAGVPVPETFVAGSPHQLLPALAGGPLVLKPYRGSQGRGVRVVRGPEDLAGDPGDGGLAFAQRFHPGDGHDRKIYCIGDRLFGVKRIWPPKTYEEKVGQPFAITSELEEITRRCGEALGLALFGVDVVLSEGTPWVVDMSGFPGFKGVPEAALHLAEAIHAAVLRAGRRETRRPRPAPAAAPLDGELALATRLAREAGAVLRRHRQVGLELRTSAVGEVVTPPDVEANELICRGLAQAHADDAIYSKEMQDSPVRLAQHRVWIIDALDAITDYARGGDEHAVSIGLAIGGQAVLGVIYNPARDELVAGYLGAGVRYNGTAARATRHEDVTTARLTASGKVLARGLAEWLAPLAEQPVSSMAYKLARVAAGLDDGVFSSAPRNEWDTCAGVALVVAAGGNATLLDGSPIAFNRRELKQALGMVAAGPRLHAPLLAALGSLSSREAIA